MANYWWIPCVFVWYIIFNYLSKWNNDVKTTASFWAVFIFGGLTPWWVIVSRMSKNIFFDGFLYDFTMFVTYVLTMSALGAGANFTTLNWIGVLVTGVGYILMRIY